MIPGDALLAVAVADAWVYPDSLAGSPVADYEAGGVGISDPSAGLLVQAWRFQVGEDGESVEAVTWPGGEPAVLATVPGVVRVSGSFDRNMAPVVAWETAEGVWLRWYDGTLPGYAVTQIAGASCPRVSHDDKREVASAVSDVQVLYLKGTGAGRQVCARQQRDRYGVERVLVEGVPEAVTSIGRVGMSVGYRFQVELLTPEEEWDPNGGQPGDAGTARTGLSRLLEFGQPWDLGRLNANVQTLAGALNALAGERWFTWEGDATGPGWTAAQGAEFEGGIAAPGLFVENRAGRLVPVLRSRAAGLNYLGTVKQLPAQADVGGWSESDMAALWGALRTLQLGMLAQGWGVEVEFPEQE